MKKLFFFLTICIFSFTTLNADNEKQPVQNLPCTVIESNIIGEDIIIYLDLPGNENYTFTSSQQLTFSSSNGNVDVLLNLVSTEIIGEDIIIYLDSPSANLSGLTLQDSQTLTIQ